MGNIPANLASLTEPVIHVQNGAGDYVSFHRHNTRKARCVECQAELASGHGVQRKMKNAPGSGYLCHTCAGNTIRTHQTYMYSRFTATLSPYDALCSCYEIPSAELAQAWHDHGAAGLRFAAETLRERAREAFLTTRNIPYVPEKISIEVPA
jgi:hypothetical protein